MATTKNLCAQIPIDLHERVSEERERLGLTTSEYIVNLIQDYEWAAAALGFLRPQWWQEHEDHRALENALLKTRTLASKKE